MIYLEKRMNPVPTTGYRAYIISGGGAEISPFLNITGRRLPVMQGITGFQLKSS